MEIEVHPDAGALGVAAAEEGAAAIREALTRDGAATIVVATGASQFAVLDALVAAPDIDWSRVTAFHLDEYIGLPPDHPASFRRYLRGRLVDRVPLGRFVPVDGDASDLDAELSRLNGAIEDERVAVCFAGIGENGHLAFNDPPADFETTAPYIAVDLDEACRRQQMGEGWFPTLEDVPSRAISMTVHRMMASDRLILTVPDERKARAVRGAVEGPVTPDLPASMAQRHPRCSLHLDPASASLLSGR